MQSVDWMDRCRAALSCSLRSLPDSLLCDLNQQVEQTASHPTMTYSCIFGKTVIPSGHKDWILFSSSWVEAFFDLICKSVSHSSRRGPKERGWEVGKKACGGWGWERYKFHIPQVQNLRNTLGCLEATWLHTELPNDIPPLVHTKQSPLCACTHSLSLATIHHKMFQRKTETSAKLYSAQWKEQNQCGKHPKN